MELALSAARADEIETWVGGLPYGVVAVVRRAFASGLVASAQGSGGVRLVGVEPSKERRASRWPSRVVSGRYLEDGDSEATVIGSGLARRLKAEVGARLVVMTQSASSGEIRSELLVVAGILETGLDDIDESIAVVPLSWLQHVLQLGTEVHQVALLLSSSDQASDLARKAEGHFRDVEVLTWAEADPQLEAFIKTDDGANYLYHLIFFLVIAFMVANTLLMSVLERQRELALLGALGLGPFSRRMMVLLEGAMLASIAIVAGLGWGLAVHTFFHHHGLPLSWFTDSSVEAAGVIFDSEMKIYSVLTPARILVTTALVFVMNVVLASLAARIAGRPTEATWLKST